MLTQRNIRKSSLLLIYALEMQHTNPKDIRDFPLENYWGLVNEHAKKKYAGMLAKAVLHESRSLAELLDAMRARAGEFETYAAGRDTTAAAAASTHAQYARPAERAGGCATRHAFPAPTFRGGRKRT